MMACLKWRISMSGYCSMKAPNLFIKEWMSLGRILALSGSLCTKLQRILIVYMPNVYMNRICSRNVSLTAHVPKAYHALTIHTKGVLYTNCICTEGVLCCSCIHTKSVRICSKCVPYTNHSRPSRVLCTYHISTEVYRTLLYTFTHRRINVFYKTCTWFGPEVANLAHPLDHLQSVQPVWNHATVHFERNCTRLCQFHFSSDRMMMDIYQLHTKTV